MGKEKYMYFNYVLEIFIFIPGSKLKGALTVVVM